MMKAISIACVLAVAAQPALAEPTCAVTIARAPDDVRAIVEQWVRAEPHCNTALEVRIVPTEGGLYLLAQDEHGRVRERVVPDARSAGVLIASWAAGDAAPAPLPPTAIDVRPPAPLVADAPPLAPPIAAPPSAGPVMVATAASLPAPAVTPSDHRWFSFGGVFALSSGGGLRGELDLLMRTYATFGIAASATNWSATSWDPNGTRTLDTFDAKALAYLALSTGSGRWHVRATVGAGLVYTHAMLTQPGSYREADGVFPAGDATLTLGRDITARWQAYGGPIVSLYAQTYQIDEMGPGYYSSSQEHRDLEAMFMIGVRRAL